MISFLSGLELSSIPQDFIARLVGTLWNESVAERLSNGADARAGELKAMALALMPYAEKYSLYFQGKIDCQLT